MALKISHVELKRAHERNHLAVGGKLKCTYRAEMAMCQSSMSMGYAGKFPNMCFSWF